MSTPMDRIGIAGAVSAASVAAAAVNQAVAAEDTLSAPETRKSWVSTGNVTRRDYESGLPLSYDKDLIEAYWRGQGSALSKRWGEFLRMAVPFLLRVATLLVQGGPEALAANDRELAKEVREICQQLGPTFVKLCQTLSVRPDVLPKAALEELAVLQDSVQPFDSEIAKMQIETELGRPIEEVFSEISDEPVAAASLAQVYKATLKKDGRQVAVKVQRPQVLEQVSQDLYVLRRAAEIYQRLSDRFAPQQKTSYVGLLAEWAVGFYSELDFVNEVANQREIREMLVEKNAVEKVYVPEAVEELCTARLAVTEWIDGVKLSECDKKEIQRLTPYAQEAFLVQLLQYGVLHSDPHPGNLLKMNDGDPRGEIALLDFGLVARIAKEDREKMVSAIVHLANKDFEKLVDDFIDLDVLPTDTSRKTVIPLMDKALSPYLAGGGAQKFQQRVLANYGIADDGAKEWNSGSAVVGGFQAMTQDAITVLNDVPFSIPPYFALVGRAIVTLEGIALSGNPEYALIQEAYPFVSRTLLRGESPRLRDSLRDALYSSESKKIDVKRLIALLASATSETSSSTKQEAFIDIDAVAAAVDDAEAVRLVLDVLLDDDKDNAIRDVLVDEAYAAVEVLTRQLVRRAVDNGARALKPNFAALPFVGAALDAATPNPLTTPLPLVSPTTGRIVLVSPKQLIDAVAPALNRDDEVFALDLLTLLKSTDPTLAAVVERTFFDAGFLDPRDFVQFLPRLYNPTDILSSFAPTTLPSSGGGTLVTTVLNDLNDLQRSKLLDLAASLLRRLADTASLRLSPIFDDGRSSPSLFPSNSRGLPQQRPVRGL